MAVFMWIKQGLDLTAYIPPLEENINHPQWAQVIDHLACFDVSQLEHHGLD